jgi:alpha-L-rhamnosidase
MNFSRRDLLKSTALLAVPASAGPSCRVTNLRCESMLEPVGIDEPKPRLSWAIESSRPGWRQTAWEIRASKERNAAAGELWSSGRVAGAESTQIEYGGRAAKAHERVWWRVRVWDETGAVSPWSEPASWVAGLPAASDWGASEWIGHDSVLESTQEKMPGEEPARAPIAKPAPHLRREFKAQGKLRRAVLSASGAGYAELWLNGEKLGGAVEREPGFTNYDHRVLYVTHDVTAQLRDGANVLGAILGTGWYDVHDIATWHFNTASWRARPALRLVLTLEYADGRVETVVSDGRWKTATGPILRDGIYTGEIYDARLEMPGWSETVFDDSAWKPVLALPGPRGRLVARACPPVAIVESWAPVEITAPKPGVYLVNLGRNSSGHVELRVTGAPRGTAITLRYGERRGADGRLDVTQIGQFMAKTVTPQPFQQDTYICSGAPEERWEQRFSYSGFQYVEVTGWPGVPKVENFRGRFAHTAMESAGEFSCSDDVANRIQQATRRAYLSNAQSIPTDCPQREKNGWTGDAQLAADTGLMNFNSAPFYSKWLNDFDDAVRPEGGVPVLVPTGGWGNGDTWPGEVTPPWDVAYPLVTWDLYHYCADRRVIERHWRLLDRFVPNFASRQLPDGTVPGLGLGDWVPWKTKAPLDFISTVYLFYDARLMERMAAVIGRKADAARYHALAERVRAGCQSRYYHADSHSYADGSQTALGLALDFELVPDALRAGVFARLVETVKKDGLYDVGILGAKSVPRALAAGGEVELAYRLMVRDTPPGWGAWIKQGATTLWEDWKGEWSLNHIMFGDVSAWMMFWLAGLQPGAPGFARVRLRPHFIGKLDHAKATHATLRGTIESGWRRTAGGVRYECVLPANVSGSFEAPAGTAGRMTIDGKPVEPRGRHELASGRHVVEMGS